MIKEFKEFINQGNLVDMAVGIVIGVAFGNLMDSLVKNIVMQIIAAVVGEPDFGGLTLTINHAVIAYGAFINALITFLAISFAMFVVVKAYNTLRKETDDEEGPDEVALLTEIRDELRARRS